MFVKIQIDPHSPRSMRRNEFERKSIRKSRRGGHAPGSGGADAPIRPPRSKKRNRGDEQPRVVTGLVRRRSIRSSTRSIKSNRSNKSNKSMRRRATDASLPPIGGNNGGNRRNTSYNIGRDDLGRKSSRRPPTYHGTNGDLPPRGGEVKGDILTKVTIGRTKSFAKTNNQYNLQVSIYFALSSMF